MFSARCLAFVRNALSSPTSSWNTEALLRAACICTSAARWNSNYYECLGIPQSSTQTDIKAAYYKLSMQYHPDKNKGSDSAAKKFQEIAQAYEVLGNYRLRRLYDKGIIHTAGSQYGQRPDMHSDVADEVPDDPETKFYKSRFNRSTVADATGRTPIYDFDEWSRAHYGASFERRKAAKKKYERNQAQNHDFIMSAQNEVVIFGMVFCVVIAYSIFYAESSNDTPKEIAKRRAESEEQKHSN